MKAGSALTLVILTFGQVMAAESYTFTTINVPGSGYTMAVGINDFGQVVGGSDNHGFVYANGSYTMFDPPGSTYTLANAINNAGQITGSFANNAPTGTHGFLDDHGSFTSFDFPGSYYGTFAQGINNAGTIIGSSATLSGVVAFIYMNGSIGSISVPGATFNQAFGINDANQIILQTNIGSGSFLDTNGVFTEITAPGAIGFTRATAINDLGQITGYFTDNTGGHIFVDTDGVFTVLDVPGNNPSIVPEALGINDKGQIVGSYFPQFGITYGFLATPIPEPSSFLLFGAGLVAIGLAIQRTHRS